MRNALPAVVTTLADDLPPLLGAKWDIRSPRPRVQALLPRTRACEGKGVHRLNVGGPWVRGGGTVAALPPDPEPKI